MVSLTLIFICKVTSTNKVFLLKNTLYTLCLRVWGFHVMSFFNCNILQGASITKLCQVCLVVGQDLGEGALVQMFCSTWWHVRTAFSFALWDQWQKGSVYGALPKLPYLWCGGCLQVINWRWRCKSQKGGSFYREGRFSLCNTAVL